MNNTFITFPLMLYYDIIDFPNAFGSPRLRFLACPHTIPLICSLTIRKLFIGIFELKVTSYTCPYLLQLYYYPLPKCFTNLEV